MEEGELRQHELPPRHNPALHNITGNPSALDVFDGLAEPYIRSMLVHGERGGPPEIAGATDCEVLVADIEDIPFPPESFDYRRLIGRPFHEVGQPINQPLMLFSRIRKLRRLGCRIDKVEGQGHYLGVPRYGTIELPWLERPHSITKWFALNALTVATKIRL